MKERLLRDLATLASERLQERYVINGTREEYLLPEEVFESALSSASSAVAPVAVSSLSPTERDATRKFVNELRDVSERLPLEDPRISNEELIMRNESWAAARSAAKVLLEQFGFDLGRWEREQGLV
jgi:hypothetical protein